MRVVEEDELFVQRQNLLRVLPALVFVYVVILVGIAFLGLAAGLSVKVLVVFFDFAWHIVPNI